MYILGIYIIYVNITNRFVIYQTDRINKHLLTHDYQLYLCHHSLSISSVGDVGNKSFSGDRAAAALTS